MMSLILDALKKSEAERRRGMPPTLHAPFGEPRRVRRKPWVAGAGAVLLVAGLAGSWVMLSRGRTDGGIEPGTQPLASAGAPVAGDAVAVATPTPDSPALDAGTGMSLAAGGADPKLVNVSSESAFGGVDAAAQGATVSGGGLPVPQRAVLFTPSATPGPETAATAPVPAPTPGAAPTPEPPTVAAAPVAAEPIAVATPPVDQFAPKIEPPAMASAPAAVELAPSKPEEVLPLVFQLPYATRKDLPKLELSMHVFSPERSERFIVLNSKRYTLESAQPGPELNLLDIVADGAVFEFRGQRFLLPRQTY